MGLTQKLGTIPLAIFTDSSNNVGIGAAASGSYKLQVTGTTNLTGALTGTSATFSGDLTLNNGSADGGQLILASSGYSNWNIDNFSGRFRAYYGSTEYFTITATGNVGIGTSSPARPLHIVGTSGDTYARTSNTAGGAQFGVTSNGDGIFESFTSGKSTLFWTGGAERARITSGGYLKVSNTGSYISSTGNAHEFSNNAANWVLECRPANASSPYGLNITYNNAAPNNTANEFISCNDNSAQRFLVRSNGGIANFQSNNVNLSDERTKKDITPLESYWDKFKAIEIVKFKYIDQTHDDFNIGVIAQQVEKVAPEFVDVDGWENGGPKVEGEEEVVSTEEPLKSIYSADLHHATIKVLQEAMARVEELEARIKQLENK